MKQHKGKIIAAAVLLCILAAAYFWGGNYAGPDGSYKPAPPVSTVTPNQSAAPDTLAADRGAPPATLETPAETAASVNPTVPSTGSESATAANPSGSAASSPPREGFSKGVEEGSLSYSEAQGMEIDPKTSQDQYLTDPVPEDKPVPVEPPDVILKHTADTCTLSVRCDTILPNMQYLNKEKVELVPADGVIFPAAKVVFYEGESVFNVLQREMKKNKIQMEFRKTPIYNSVYIESIQNLYEFDCGELSGWMYKVNGWFPNYGCSRYQLKADDVVEWVYTCDLGRDVGGYYAAGGE